MTGEGVVAFVEILEIVVVIVETAAAIEETAATFVEIVVAEGAVQGNKESRFSRSFSTRISQQESNYLPATLILRIPKLGRQRTRYTPSQRRRSDSTS